MPYLESIRVFTRTVELGSITAGGRDNRLTPAVASNRIKELEERLGVRLFNRTTRRLTPTEVGRAYYDTAKRVLEAIEEAEAAVASFSLQPRGVAGGDRPPRHRPPHRRPARPRLPRRLPRHRGAAPPLGPQGRLPGRRRRRRLRPRDARGFQPQDAHHRRLRARPRRQHPPTSRRAAPPRPRRTCSAQDHNCLLLRFPGSHEYYWTFSTHDGPVKITPHGAFDADDADILADWALAGAGIANRPRFEIAEHLASGALVPLLAATPPVPDPLRLPLPPPPPAGPQGAGLHPLDDRTLPESGARAAQPPGGAAVDPLTRSRVVSTSRRAGPPSSSSRPATRPFSAFIPSTVVRGGVDRAASGMSL